MALTIEATPAPLEMTSQGSVRVRGSRVTLDTVVAAFERGASAEEIVLQYPTLQLADVYSVIGYYLRHHDAVAAYLRERDDQAALIRQRVERRSPQHGIRERLLARTSDAADHRV